MRWQQECSFVSPACHFFDRERDTGAVSVSVGSAAPAVFEHGFPALLTVGGIRKPEQRRRSRSLLEQTALCRQVMHPVLIPRGCRAIGGRVTFVNMDNSDRAVMRQQGGAALGSWIRATRSRNCDSAPCRGGHAARCARGSWPRLVGGQESPWQVRLRAERQELTGDRQASAGPITQVASPGAWLCFGKKPHIQTGR